MRRRKLRHGSDAIGGICWRRVPAENGAATLGMRATKLFRNEFLDGWTGGLALELTRLIVQAPQRAKIFITAELRFLHGRFERLDRLVVDLDRHRKWMSVLSAMRD